MFDSSSPRAKAKAITAHTHFPVNDSHSTYKDQASTKRAPNLLSESFSKGNYQINSHQGKPVQLTNKAKCFKAFIKEHILLTHISFCFLRTIYGS